MRTLFITGEYPPMHGGVADYTRELGRALVALGQTVGVVTSAAAAGETIDPDIEVFAEMRHWGWSSSSVLNRRVESWRPDIVHIQYQTAAFGMHPAINLWPGRHRATRTAVTFHDLRQPYLFPKAHPVRRWTIKRLACGCDLAITTNPEDSARLRRTRIDLLEIPIGSNIPCAPPPDFDRNAWRAQYGITPDNLVICYFGFFNDSKGGKILLGVLESLVAKGIDAHLLLIGGHVGASDPTNYAYLQQVKERIAATNLAARIHWTGHIPPAQVSAAFLSSDVALLPYLDGVSYRRGSLMAAIEHGMAIVSTTPNVLYPDLVNGENILLAPPDDLAAMTSATERALTQPELRQRLGENARLLGRQFTWEAIAARSLDAYTTLLQHA
ncbi:MAG: glycosyltransferase family 4 protein [Caldilineales bacterium]|nr:glycosyltransferase family 4 protein [Caldilineales bacterium]